jgi:hypothetical protein
VDPAGPVVGFGVEQTLVLVLALEEDGIRSEGVEINVSILYSNTSAEK